MESSYIILADPFLSLLKVKYLQIHLHMPVPLEGLVRMAPGSLASCSPLLTKHYLLSHDENKKRCEKHL